MHVGVKGLNFMITKMEFVHFVGDREVLLSECSAGNLELRTEVEVHMVTYCLFATNHQWQLAHRQNNFDHDGG